MLIFEAENFAFVSYLDTHDFNTVFVFKLDLQTASISMHKSFEGERNVSSGKLYSSSFAPNHPWIEVGDRLLRLDSSMNVIEAEQLSTLTGTAG